MAVLPMFPLGSVLLPGEVLPLHVFEPRYRQMMIDLLASDVEEPEFGVTLIERGHEVGGGDHRSAIGTVAQIARIEAVDPERYAVIAIGTRRIMVNAWLPDDPYPLADVDEYPDAVPTNDAELGELAVHVAASHARVLQVHRLAAELGEADPDQDFEISQDPRLASYHLVALSPLGAADRYRLLGAATLMQRLELLDQALSDVEAMLKFRAS
jgi:uncharacterized protein